jgi:hypothetical protein
MQDLSLVSQNPCAAMLLFQHIPVSSGLLLLSVQITRASADRMELLFFSRSEQWDFFLLLFPARPGCQPFPYFFTFMEMYLY